MTDPRSAYSALLEKRRSDIVEHERRHRLFGYFQLACAGAAVAVVWAALAKDAFSVAWVMVPVAVFTALLIVHDRVLAALERRRRAERHFTRAIARIDGNWAGHGESGARYLDPAHPYAQDLDLFGKGSLFELLCTARTHIGEETLARWLLHPAPPEEVRRRQEAVEELRPRLDLREDLAIVAEEARTGIDPVSLAAWGEAPSLLPANLKWRLRLLTGAGMAGLIALFVMLSQMAGVLILPDQTAELPRDVLLLVLVINGAFLYRMRAGINRVVDAVEEAAHELRSISEILLRLERERFRSPLLASLRTSLDAEGDPPSKRLARLRRLTEYLDSRDNVFVRILEVFLLWTPHLAVNVERWRRHSGPAVRRWLNATGEIEALCSLSAHAYEHPDDPFAEFSELSPCIEADAIGHPLIPERRVVRNDVQISGELQVLVVSGSNMSGKSTLLRTLGVNAVLAQAGATVRAKRLRLSPLAIGASIRVNDSLQGGVSRFYAEILRLRQILDLTGGPLPVLFLIDEFLHGTNSHDRRIGAAALVRGLIRRGAIGLITTHDLAIADIAGELGSRAANVHFEDHLEDGQIHFDYRMQPGIVRKSNALELMRSVGLEI
jgi:hypothetical protein